MTNGKDAFMEFLRRVKEYLYRNRQILRVLLILVICALIIIRIVTSTISILGHKPNVILASRLEAISASSPYPGISVSDSMEHFKAELQIEKQDDYDSLMVIARVLQDGSPVDSARVWVVARDDAGNSYAPGTVLTGEDGSANLGPIPRSIGADISSHVSRITVWTLLEPENGDAINRVEYLRLETPKVITTIRVSPAELSIVGLLFLLSILIPLTGVRGSYHFLTYFSEIMLTLLLGVALIVIFMEGARVVDCMEQETGSTSVLMGFIHIVKDSYLQDRIPEEWIVTLSSHENGTPGFGAPLWVILMSVVGAVITAIGTILSGLKTCLMKASPPDGWKKIDITVHTLIKHQLIMLFSPIGAIFLYQIMLLTGTADENLTVGLAALAAGGGMNALLNKAQKLVASLIREESLESSDT